MGTTLGLCVRIYPPFGKDIYTISRDVYSEEQTYYKKHGAISSHHTCGSDLISIVLFTFTNDFIDYISVQIWFIIWQYCTSAA